MKTPQKMVQKQKIRKKTKKTKIGKTVQEIYDEVKCSEIDPACIINNGMIRVDSNFKDTGNPDDDNYDVLQYIITLQNKLKFDSSVYQDILTISGEEKTAESEFATVHYHFFSGMGLEVVYDLK